MKKVLLAALAVVFVNTVMAQRDTLVSGEGMHVLRTGRRGELMIEMGGYGIMLGNRSGFSENPDRRSKQSVRFGLGFSNVELGFSMLTSPAYKGYDPAVGDFMELRTGKSTHFGFRFVNLSVALNRERNLFLRTGLHLMCDNYTFAGDHTLQRIDGRIVPVAFDEPYRKSKLLVATIGLPVQLSYSPAPRFYVSALAYADVVFNSHTKYKRPIDKARLSGVAAFQPGVGLSLSYRGIGIYAKYGLTTLFRDGVGPKTHPVSVGLYFGR